MQIHGGMGFIEETGIAQYVRDARILTIYEGTNGIQALDFLWRKTIKNNFEAADSFIAEMEDFVNKEFQQDQFSLLKNSMNDCLVDLRDVLDWLKTNRNNREVCNSAATHYLHLFGLVFGAWMIFRSANLTELQKDKKLDAEQCGLQKTQTAEFYAAQILPNIKSLKRKIIADKEGKQGCPKTFS